MIGRIRRLIERRCNMAVRVQEVPDGIDEAGVPSRQALQAAWSALADVEDEHFSRLADIVRVGLTSRSPVTFERVAHLAVELRNYRELLSTVEQHVSTLENALQPLLMLAEAANNRTFDEVSFSEIVQSRGLEASWLQQSR
jgi:hypothetical protein